VVEQVKVQPKNRVVALTFDDGPWPVYTERVLAVLRGQDVHATFFMIGQNVRNYPSIAQHVFEQGHAVGNHTWNHPSRPRGARTEIVRTDDIFKKTLGFTPTLFRPPYGNMRNGLTTVAKQQGKAVIMWSVDSADWRRGTAAAIQARSLKHLKPGAIILLHDGGGNRDATVAALPGIISSLRAKGYRFVTVPELLAMHVAPKPRLAHAKRADRKLAQAKPAPQNPKKAVAALATPSRTAPPR
jgi:chitin deacetylase